MPESGEDVGESAAAEPPESVPDRALNAGTHLRTIHFTLLAVSVGVVLANAVRLRQVARTEQRIRGLKK